MRIGQIAEENRNDQIHEDHKQKQLEPHLDPHLYKNYISGWRVIKVIKLRSF